MGDVSITLGGIWKEQHDQKVRLESSVSKLRDDLDATRRDLDHHRSAAATYHTQLETLREKHDALRRENTQLSRELSAEMQARQQATAALTSAQTISEGRLASLTDTQAMLRAARQERDLSRAQLDEAMTTVEELRDEIDALQRQYERMELKRAHAVEEAARCRRTTDLMTKAKTQKENHVVLLLKEKERLFRQLTQARTLLNRSLGNRLGPKDRDTAVAVAAGTAPLPGAGTPSPVSRRAAPMTAPAATRLQELASPKRSMSPVSQGSPLPSWPASLRYSDSQASPVAGISPVALQLDATTTTSSPSSPSVAATPPPPPRMSTATVDLTPEEQGLLTRRLKRMQAKLADADRRNTELEEELVRANSRAKAKPVRRKP